MHLITFKPMPAPTALPYPILLGFDRADTPAYRHRTGPARFREYAIFQYSLSGEGRLRFDGREFLLPAGGGVITTSHDVRFEYYYPDDGVLPWEFLYLEFYGTGMSAAINEMIAHGGPCFSLDVKKNFLAELLEFRQRSGTQILSCQAGTQLVYGLLAALAPCRPDTAARHPVALACALIAAHPERSFTVTELAATVNMSREYFTRQFKSSLGISPWQYVLREKIKQGCLLLRADAMTNKEIAGRLGFESAAKFERIFRRLTGFTPKAFRRHDHQLQVIREFDFPSAKPFSRPPEGRTITTGKRRSIPDCPSDR